MLLLKFTQTGMYQSHMLDHYQHWITYKPTFPKSYEPGSRAAHFAIYPSICLFSRNCCLTSLGIKSCLRLENAQRKIQLSTSSSSSDHSGNVMAAPFFFFFSSSQTHTLQCHGRSGGAWPHLTQDTQLFWLLFFWSFRLSVFMQDVKRPLTKLGYLFFFLEGSTSRPHVLRCDRVKSGMVTVVHVDAFCRLKILRSESDCCITGQQKWGEDPTFGFLVARSLSHLPVPVSGVDSCHVCGQTAASKKGPFLLLYGQSVMKCERQNQIPVENWTLCPL